MWILLGLKGLKETALLKSTHYESIFLFSPPFLSSLKLLSVSRAGKRPTKSSSVSSVRSCSKFSKLQLVHIHHKAVGVLSF